MFSLIDNILAKNMFFGLLCLLTLEQLYPLKNIPKKKKLETKMNASVNSMEEHPVPTCTAGSSLFQLMEIVLYETDNRDMEIIFNFDNIIIMHIYNVNSFSFFMISVDSLIL